VRLAEGDVIAGRPGGREASRTEGGAYLLDLASRIARAYRTQARPAAILLTGSVALGLSDCYSDIDLVAYHDALPAASHLQAAHQRIRDVDHPSLGPRTDWSIVETYRVRGVECQVGHTLVGRVEQEIAAVLAGQDLSAVTHKKLVGLVNGRPLHGAALIREWQARLADYPDALARAMVEHYLGHIVPLWVVQDGLARRDAALWREQVLVETAFQVLGILAALNRRYYSPFQFKRLHRFTDQLPIKPHDLANRLDGLFGSDRQRAVAQVEALVRETIALVERHLPEVDTAPVRRQLGQRQAAWPAITEASCATPTDTYTWPPR